MKLPIGCLVLVGASIGACISVPPEESPPISARKATAIVDSSGRTIEGGNLVIAIPPGALDESERITVTIDAVKGAPARHLSEAYLVNPEGQTFNLPVQITYKYRGAHVASVGDRNALFLGVAVGASWQPLDGQQHDQAAQRVAGEVLHFSTFGLVDPNAPLDGGVILDAAFQDRTGRDAAGFDTRPRDSGSPGEIRVRLVWSNTTDIDLHLLHGTGPAFSNTADCYYATCKTVPLEWPPAGAAGNPQLVLDVMDGTLGPEETVIAQPADANLIVAVHGYTRGTGAANFPTPFTLTIWHGNTQIFSTNGQIDQCDQLRNVADIAITNGGANVSATQRTDAPTLAGHSSC